MTRCNQLAIDERDLEAELDAATSHLGGKEIDRLGELGVSFEAILRCGYVGIDRILKFGRCYQPDPNGHHALIVPVWSGEPPSVYSESETPILCDLVALHTGNPRAWWYRIGQTPAVLGRHWLDRGESPALFTDPLSWLRAGCAGVVPLDAIEDHYARRRMATHLQEISTGFGRSS